MWKEIIEKFDNYPSQKKVAIKLLELGLRIDENNKIYCKDVEINISSLAKSVDTDRRVVVSTIDNILNDELLKEVFMNLYPAGPVLSKLSNSLDIGVIEIEGSGERPGILSEVTKILANKKISIRQAYASDSEIDFIPHLTIITNKMVPGELLQSLLKIEGIHKVSIA